MEQRIDGKNSELILGLSDEGDAPENQKSFANQVACELQRTGGRTIGFAANLPVVHASAFDSGTSRDAAGFMPFYDCFGIPLVTIADVPRCPPGTDQKFDGLTKHRAAFMGSGPTTTGLAENDRRPVPERAPPCTVLLRQTVSR